MGTQKFRIMHIDTGLGIAIAGLWLPVEAAQGAPSVTSRGMKIAQISATLMTIMIERVSIAGNQ